MNFSGVTKDFEGDRVRLRILQKSDAELPARWINDPEVNRFMTTKHATLESQREYIAQKNTQSDALFFGIFLKEEDRMIGTIKLEPIEIEKKRATIAIMIGDKNEWGKGYAGEAMKILMDWCFGELGCDEVNLGVVAKNEAAIKAYKKLGFTETKRDLKYITYGDEVHDQVWMTAKRV